MLEKFVAKDAKNGNLSSPMWLCKKSNVFALKFAASPKTKNYV